MTPHAILAVAAVALKLLFPRPLRWLATETALVRVFSHWIPLGGDDCAALRCVGGSGGGFQEQRMRSQQQQQQRDPLTPVQAGRHNQRRKKSNTSSSTKKRRQSVLDRVRRGSPEKQQPEATTAAATVEQRKVAAAQQYEYWLHYWMICAALAALPTLFRVLPFVARLAPQWLGSVAAQLHLLFWIWIHAVPYLTPPQLRQQLGASVDPVHWLVETVLAPTATSVYHGVSSVLVPPHVWETYVHQPADKVLGLAATLKLVSARRQETLGHVIGEEPRPARARRGRPVVAHGEIRVAVRAVCAAPGAVGRGGGVSTTAAASTSAGAAIPDECCCDDSLAPILGPALPRVGGAQRPGGAPVVDPIVERGAVDHVGGAGDGPGRASRVVVPALGPTGTAGAADTAFH